MIIYPSLEELASFAAGLAAGLAAEAMAERGRFCVALSGGSVIRVISPQLTAEPLRTDINWSGWHVFWADERCVSPFSPESNYGVAEQLLFRHVPIPRGQIYALDDTLGASDAARAYESVLSRVFRTGPARLPRFDLILLGIGEDGHTASLFPGHPLLEERDRWVAPVLDAPKPPRERITLTLPVINNARHVLFVVAGAGKKAILSEVFGSGVHRPGLPAERIILSDGYLRWLVDAAAAGDLQITD